MSATSPAAGAPLDLPAPAAAARAHGAIHVEVGAIDGLTTLHDNGRVSIRLTDHPLHVYVTGTPDELHAFASELHRHANRAARRLLRPPSPDVADDPVVIPKPEAAA